MRIFKSLLVWWVLFFPLHANAHEFEITQASVIVHSDSEFSVSIDLDLIELFGNQFELEGSSEEIIEGVRSLPLSDIVKATNGVKEELLDGVEVYVDGSQVPLQKFSSPPAIRLFQLLQRNPDTTNYRAEFLSEAKFKGVKGGSELQIRFPESLGTVSLFIASPQQTLLGINELSNGYQMEMGGIQGFSTKAATAVNYAHHGFLHVLPLGLDHILFVVALCMLSTRVSTLIWQISAFTLAHTLTLGLSSAGVVSLPASIVEPIIALSIAWVAFENLMTRKLQRWRLLIVFLFGLIHGLGFASALMALGLSTSQWFTSLIFFNIGVELGQLAVIAITLAVIYWWWDKPWYPKMIQTPVCLMIGLMGLYWAAERVFF